MPDLAERINFEELYDQFQRNGLPKTAIASSPSTFNDSNEIHEMTENDLVITESVIQVDNSIRTMPITIVYQNMNIKTAQDIRNIQSIDLKVAIKNYEDDRSTLQNNERSVVARSIVHHLLVANVERV